MPLNGALSSSHVGSFSIQVSFPTSFFNTQKEVEGKELVKEGKFLNFYF